MLPKDITESFRQIDFDEDYNDIAQWFKHWKFPAIPREFMPDTTFILERQGVKICSACLYIAQTGKLSICEWTVINPNAPKELRKDAILHLLTSIEEQSKLLGMKFIFTSTKTKSLGKILMKAGFQETDTNATNYLRGL